MPFEHILQGWELPHKPIQAHIICCIRQNTHVLKGSHAFLHIIVPHPKPSQVFRAFAQPVPTKAVQGAALAFALPRAFGLAVALGVALLAIDEAALSTVSKSFRNFT